MIDPIRRSVTVAAEPHRTFRTFTREIGSWWPAETHWMAADREGGSTVTSVTSEEWEGGRVVEITGAGSAWETVRRRPGRGTRRGGRAC